MRVKRERKRWTRDWWTVVEVLRTKGGQRAGLPETREYAPLLTKTLGVLEEVLGAGVGLGELGLDLVAAEVHRVEVRLEHAQFLRGKILVSYLCDSCLIVSLR